MCVLHNTFLGAPLAIVFFSCASSPACLTHAGSPSRLSALSAVSVDRGAPPTGQSGLLGGPRGPSGLSTRPLHARLDELKGSGSASRVSGSVRASARMRLTPATPGTHASQLAVAARDAEQQMADGFHGHVRWSLAGRGGGDTRAPSGAGRPSSVAMATKRRGAEPRAPREAYWVTAARRRRYSTEADWVPRWKRTRGEGTVSTGVTSNRTATPLPMGKHLGLVHGV
ncbi:unnamed protein product [Arctogadus glacialis]